MSASQRRKGQRWEREVARELREASGRDYQRVLEEVRSGNCGDVRRADGECDPIPVAAIHRTGRGGEKLVALDWDDFMEIVSALPAYDWLVQAKCGARPNVFGALKEAKEAK